MRLPKTFTRFKYLEKLDLSNNLFEEIPEVVGRMRCLEKLDMRGNRIQRVRRSVAEMLFDSEMLEKIDLRGNELRRESDSEWVGWEELEEMFKDQVLLSQLGRPGIDDVE
ncbi:hypothetical protein [Encephalitozoon cuniculi GB-M1]|uniref:Uncharacterized protein n=1 Tax=Encephalitozoon cuniculi (strain GB-M1) TaxID=284813 RepID=Q8SVG0_ENCCU|nr:uncharacterized protein ECU05_1560 [Encephalitozoon cuniculi GB-M1]UYI27954.1 leucine-rich repeat domain-containing protein [Encephalitozoon cuniculi]CAD26676.1 hypothetical protein [Encephalitozoon cuniculi GB-M1]